MKIKTSADLTMVDQRLGYSNWPDAPADDNTHVASAINITQQMIADCDLATVVPVSVRERFETCRTLHIYGSFAYEFFTVASTHAYMTLEAALGARFIEYYVNRIPLLNENDDLEYLEATSYSAVVDSLRPKRAHRNRDKEKENDLGRKQQRRKKVRLKGFERFDGSLHSLLEWAEATNLLTGQRNRVVVSAIHLMRNQSAHPHGPSLISQGQSAGAIRDIAEIVNHLWGQDTPGGRLYSMPLERRVVCLHREESGNAAIYDHLPTLSNANEMVQQSGGLWVLLEAVPSDHIFTWSHDFESTAYPTVELWQGSSWIDAIQAWQMYEASGQSPQACEWRDRLFLVRRSISASPLLIEPARSPAQFRSLPVEMRDLLGTEWWIIRADYPQDTAKYWRDEDTIPAMFRSGSYKRFLPSRSEVDKGDSWQQTEARLVKLEEK